MQTLIPMTLWLILGATLSQERIAQLPDALEEQIAQALMTNPEVLMAEAKMREAEAAYREARLRITQEVMQAHNDLQTGHMMVQQSRMKLEETARLQGLGMVSEAEVFQAETGIIQHQNQLSQIRARLQYLLGVEPGAPTAPSSGSTSASAASRSRPSRPALSAEAEAFLDLPVKAGLLNAPFSQVLPMINDVLSSANPPLSIVVNEYALESFGISLDEVFVNWEAREAPLRNFLAAIADIHGLCFVIRDYGILVTQEDQAHVLYAPVIPAELEMDWSVVPMERR